VWEFSRWWVEIVIGAEIAYYLFADSEEMECVLIFYSKWISV